METRKKEILILFTLGSMAFGLWLFILSTINSLAKEFEKNYTGVVRYAWRWEKLPIKIVLDPEIKISPQELKLIEAHFNYFFQSRHHSAMIEFVSEDPGSNQAYLKLERFNDSFMGYTIKDGHNRRPSIYLSKDYLNWTDKTRMGVLMHELGHLVGLPHFESEGSLMKEIQKSPPNSLSMVEQELIYLLYSKKLANDLIQP